MGDSRLYTQLRRTAESHYSEAATSYRRSDDLAKDLGSHSGKCSIITDVTERFARPIRLLDLGCGTGRYFHCMRNVRAIVGVDPSAHMLEQARSPVGGQRTKVTLIRSTLHEVAFAPKSFDVVICVGVLSHWCGVDAYVMKRVAEMLRDDGCFFFTAEEPRPDWTFREKLAAMVRPVLFGALSRQVDARLMDFGITEPQLRTLAEPWFRHLEVTKWQSPTGRVDLHCLASGSKVAAFAAAMVTKGNR